MKNLPTAKAHDAVKIAAPTRREHPVAGVVGGSTVLGSPAAAIEAHGNAGAPKRLTPPMAHPSMTGNGNRGFAVRKGVEPAAPINANPATASKPTIAPPVHRNATGRRSAGADTPGDSSGVGLHDATGAEANAVLAEGMQHVNNRALPGEVHHSSVSVQDIINEVEKTIV